MERTCKKCGETKPIEEFTKDKKCKLGYRFICKRCKNNYQSLREVHSKRLIKKRQLFDKGLKKCCTCKKIKPVNYFGLCKRNKDGHDDHCKICACNFSKTFYNINKKGKIKIYNELNKNSIKQKASLYMPMYYINNKNLILKRVKEYGTRNRNNITDLYIISLIQKAYGLKRQNIKKNSELIESHHMYIKIKRLLKSKKDENIKTS